MALTFIYNKIAYTYIKYIHFFLSNITYGSIAGNYLNQVYDNKK